MATMRVIRAAVLLLSAVGVAHAAAPRIPSAEWLLDQVKILSAPETEGRASGTPGAERAARHIAGAFREAGLAPGGDAGTYFQSFPVMTGIHLGVANSLTILTPSQRSMTLGRDFTPLAVSSDGSVTADLVFAGYGISAPDLGYDDYAGLDVRGKIVLVLTGEPRARDPASPFRRPEAYHYSERSHKIINAREHGASAIAIVPHPVEATDAPPPLRGISQPWGILAVGVTRAVADSLLAHGGRRVADLADGIDRSLSPHSFPLTGVQMKVAVSLVRERGTAFNVVGILPGTDARLGREAVVVGAHYDHLGRGGEGSLAPDQIGVIHPGADDNASGTAAVMGLARAFATGDRTPRTIVFVAFAGEEMGLLGSSHFVRTAPFPEGKTVFMVNLDMVGRLRDGKLYVAGVDSGEGLRGLVTEAARGLGLVPQLRGDPFSPSDHTAFYTAGVPVLFLFTGAHSDYHRPSDTWEKLNPQGLETATAFAARVVTTLAGPSPAPTYVKLHAAPPERGSNARGSYGPFFGIVPDFGEAEQPGAKIGGVRPGSPAEKAGIRAGDLIVSFAGVTVKTLDDLAFALRSHRPGDRVEVIVVRDGREHRMEAVLEARR